MTQTHLRPSVSLSRTVSVLPWKKMALVVTRWRTHHMGWKAAARMLLLKCTLSPRMEEVSTEDYDPDASQALCFIESNFVGLALEQDGTGGSTLAHTSQCLERPVTGVEDLSAQRTPPICGTTSMVSWRRRSSPSSRLTRSAEALTCFRGTAAVPCHRNGASLAL